MHTNKQIKSEVSFFTVMIIFIILFLNSCASATKEVCPSVEQQAVSTCRAKEKCTKEQSTSAIGTGYGMGTMGAGATTTTPVRSYSDCVNQDLAEQKSNQTLKK